MRLSFLFFILISLASCKKGEGTAIFPTTEGQNWCEYDTINCEGDSQTRGDGTIPYPTILAEVTGKVVNNYGKPGYTSTAVAREFKPTHNPTILFVGKNNSWQTERILFDIDSMVTALGHDRYLIITTWGTNTQTDWKGDSTQTWSGMLNWVYTDRSRQLVAKYGKRCIDLLPILQANADGSYEDSIAIVHNVAPPSLSLDIVHMNTKANAILVGEIANRLSECKNVRE